MFYAGGTIGMQHGKQGLEPAPDLFSRIKPLLPSCWLDSEFAELFFTERTPLLDSSAMNAGDWFALAAELRNEEKHFDAFILLQGTDTLAWTASALDCLLADFSRPLLLTAAQKPLGVHQSDALDNLLFTLEQAISLQHTGIFISFNQQLLPATRTRKFDSQQANAFVALPPTEPASPTIFPLNFTPTQLQHLATNFRPRLLRLPLIPGMNDAWLAEHIQDLDGLLLEGLGSGNTPPLPAFFHHLKQLQLQGVLVGLISQCWQGGVTHDYAASNALYQAGVIQLGEMTPEAAETRLTCLLAGVFLDQIKLDDVQKHWPIKNKTSPFM
nr:asparaginase domain-containing protein [Marinospirillum sp.]